MTLPIPTKTWHTDLNIEERHDGTANGNLDRRRILFNIKDKLCNLPVPWVVAGSSDGFTSGMDGPANGGAVDRWVTAADISFGANGSSGMDPGNAGVSWIVLRQSAINPKFELLFKCHAAGAAGGGTAQIRVSPTQGFGAVNGGTDGSTANTDPPTALDQIAIMGDLNNLAGQWLDGTGANTAPSEDFIFHFWQSSDGECTRMYALNVAATSFNCLSAFFEKPKNPVDGWENPSVFAWHTVSVNTGLHRFTIWNDTNVNMRFNSPEVGGEPMYITCEGYKTATIPEQLLLANELSGAWEIYPQGLATNYIPVRGRHGERFDIWWVSAALNNADTMPLNPAPTKEFCVFDDMLMVWDGSTPVTT